MASNLQLLSLPDDKLLAQCEIHIYRASGPGGQHRNKVSSAVRLQHRPTGITAQGEGSRSQHTNKRTALGILRMKFACQIRNPISDNEIDPPEQVKECLVTRRGTPGLASMVVSRKNSRFWPVVAYLLDLLDAFEGQVSGASAQLGVSSSNFIKILKTDRHSFTAAQNIRKLHNQKPLH